MYELAAIGGMEPLATQEFLRRVIVFVDVKCDQGHINICILNVPQISDLTEAIIYHRTLPAALIINALVK